MPRAGPWTLALRVAAGAVVLVACLAAAVGGKRAYHRLYPDTSPIWRECRHLSDVAWRHKALTPEEFDRAVALADSGDVAVQMHIVQPIEIALKADPAYRPKVLALFTRWAAVDHYFPGRDHAIRRVRELTAPTP